MGNHTSMRAHGKTPRYASMAGDNLTRFPPVTQRVADGIVREGQDLWPRTMQTGNEWAATIDRVDGSVLIAREGEKDYAPNLPVNLIAAAHHLHTHPVKEANAAAPINTTDIQSGIDRRVLSMTVFSDRYVYHIRPGAKGWGMTSEAFAATVRPRWNTYHEAGFLERGGAALWRARAVDGPNPALEAVREAAAHDAWQRVAQELGWTYSRTPREHPSIPLG